MASTMQKDARIEELEQTTRDLRNNCIQLQTRLQHMEAAFLPSSPQLDLAFMCSLALISPHHTSPHFTSPILTSPSSHPASLTSPLLTCPQLNLTLTSL